MQISGISLLSKGEGSQSHSQQANALSVTKWTHEEMEVSKVKLNYGKKELLSAPRLTTPITGEDRHIDIARKTPYCRRK